MNKKKYLPYAYEIIIFDAVFIILPIVHIPFMSKTGVVKLFCHPVNSEKPKSASMDDNLYSRTLMLMSTDPESTH